MKSRNGRGAVLVHNVAAAESLQHMSITINLSKKLVRNETMEGRKYKVAPMVMILEGVHNGSSGKIYYPAKSLREAPSNWDHKPIVVYHPTINGMGVSACSPSILTAQKVGVILNTRVDKKGPGGLTRLCAEAWIEEDRAKEVDSRVAIAVNQGKMMELSTGLHMDCEIPVDLEKAVWNGESYDAVAKNLRPDHLALLPDKVGACSTKDGAGFIRNADISAAAKKGGAKSTAECGDEDEDDECALDETIEAEGDDNGALGDKIKRNADKAGAATDGAMEATKGVEDHVKDRGPKANATVKALSDQASGYAGKAKAAKNSKMAAMHHSQASRTYDKASIANFHNSGYVKTTIALQKAAKAHAAAAKAHAGTTGNDLSSNDVSSALSQALQDRFGKTKGTYPDGSPRSVYRYVQDVFRKFFVYCEDSCSYALAYTIDEDDQVTLSEDEPTEVTRTTQYKDAEGNVVANVQTAPTGPMGMDAKESSTVVGVTASNPATKPVAGADPAKKKKKYVGDEDQEVAVMQAHNKSFAKLPGAMKADFILNGGPGSGRYPAGSGANRFSQKSTDKHNAVAKAGLARTASQNANIQSGFARNRDTPSEHTRAAALHTAAAKHYASGSQQAQYHLGKAKEHTASAFAAKLKMASAKAFGPKGK